MPRQEDPEKEQVDSRTGVQQGKFSLPKELGVKLAEQALGTVCGASSRPYPNWSWHSPWREGCRRCAAGALLWVPL